ncbi:MAG: hypothetical protein KGH60_00310 [Candidatus Micrarchaeota archaeon]|nr:hypothetical protein [Candidatus Micrarchaeota archaeon]
MLSMRTGYSLLPAVLVIVLAGLAIAQSNGYYSNGQYAQLTAQVSNPDITATVGSPIQLNVYISGCSSICQVQAKLGGSSSAQVLSSGSAQSLFSLQYTPSQSGFYVIEFYVTDPATGLESTATQEIQVSPSIVSANPLTVSVSPQSTSTQVGDSVSLTVLPYGGNPGYTITPIVNGQSYPSYYDSTYSPYTFTITPSTVGPYSMQFRVTDLSGQTALGSASVSAVPNPFQNQINPQISVSPSYQKVNVGSTQAITTNINGGVPPYTVSIYQGSQLLGSSGSLQYSVTGLVGYSWTYYFTGYSVGTTPLGVVVTDKNGNQATATVVMDVVSSGGTTSGTSTGTAASGGITATVTPGYLSVPVGNQAQISVTPQSSLCTPCYITVYLNGQYQTTANSNSGQSYLYTFTPAIAATYQAEFDVLDSSGAHKVVYYAVVNSQGSGGAASSGSGTTPYSGGSVSVSTTTIPQTYTQLSLSLTPPSGVTSVSVGQQFSSTVSVSGGSGQYTIYVYQNNAEVQSALGSSWTYSFAPSSPGLYTIQFKVVDRVTGQQQSVYEVVSAGGGTSTTTTTPTSTTVASGGQLSLSLTPPSGVASVSVGHSFSSTVSVSGGSGQYSITVFQNGANVQSGLGSSLSYSFTPSAPGQYTLQFRVSDRVTGQQQSIYEVVLAS